MHFQKTFVAILDTPVSISELVAGELLWGAIKSMLYGITIIIVIALFSLVSSFMIILLILCLFLYGLIFAKIAVIAVAIVPGIDSFNYFYTLFIMPMFLFSGISFPLDALPPAVANIIFSRLYTTL